VSVPVTTLERWNENSFREVVPDGRWRIELSRAASRTAQNAVVKVTGRITPRVKYVTVQPDQVVLSKGSTLNLNAVNPWLAPDTNPSYEQPHPSGDYIIEAVNNDESFVNLATANVSYRSNNPAVARISSAGVITAVSAGVVSISVTVNGVTGSTPIVVQ
jgi:beta-glucosidase